MAGDVVLVGEIPAEGVGALLRTIEERRVSGVIRFEEAGAWREVALLAGSLVEPSPGSNDDDALEALLAAQAGRYEVIARLPPLPVSQGDARVRSGSLAVHVPADLMGWCERAGLSGKLTFLRDGDQVEARYAFGELVEIQLAGQSEGDLGAVFAWEEGAFRIEADVPHARAVGAASQGEPRPQADANETRAPISPDAHVDADASGDDVAQTPVSEEKSDADAMHAPRRGRGRDDATLPIAPAPRRDDTGQRFLRVVETTLGAIVDQAEKQRAPSRSSPPLPMPTLRPPSVPPPPRAPREATVRIVFLTGEIAPLEAARPHAGSRTDDVPKRVLAAVDAPDSMAASAGGLVAAIALVAAFAAFLLRVR